MIDPQLLDELKRDWIPKLNPRVAEGYARTQLDTVDRDLHDVLYSAKRGFPEGLVYEAYERVSPTETFKYLTSPMASSTKSQFDLARTDVFLVRFKFSFQGQPVKDQYLFLPFVDDCSRMHIRNSLFYIKPVVADTLISVESDYIFINLTSTNGNIYKRKYTVLVDGVAEYHNIIYALLHHELSKLHRKYKNKAVKLRILSVAHYLFAKFGVLETFRRFEDTDLFIGTDDINVKEFPKEDWVIVESSGIKPDGHPDKFWVGHNIRVALPRAKATPHVLSLLTSMFFVLDNYPNELTPEWVKDKDWWVKILGVIVFGTEMSEIDAFDKAREHFVSMDGYFDTIAREEARNRNIFKDDMYEFLHYLSENFTLLLSTEVERGANSMYGKRLTVSRYILLDIYENIFKQINFSKKKSGQMTKQDIETMLSKAFKLRQVFEINSGLQYVSTIQSPSDCRMFKITCSVLPQQKTQPKSNEISVAALRDPKRTLDISFVECGAIQHLPKSHPIGDAIVSPFVKTTSNGTMVPSTEYAELIRQTEKLIALDF